jgi:hypothetical protein
MKPAMDFNKLEAKNPRQRGIVTHGNIIIKNTQFFFRKKHQDNLIAKETINQVDHLPPNNKTR